MRILVALSCSNPDIDAASYGVIELNAEEAAKLVALHTRVRVFLLHLADDGLASKFFAPSFGLGGYPFVAYRHTEQMAELLPNGDRLAVLADDVKLEIDEDDGEERVECFRGILCENGVELAASAKHGDYRLVAEELPVELLRKIAGLK